MDGPDFVSMVGPCQCLDTEEDVVLAPSAFWQLPLAKKLEKALRRKTARHRRIRPDDTVIVTSTSDRTTVNAN